MAIKVIDKGWNKYITELKKSHISYSKVGFPIEADVKAGTQKGSGHAPKESMIELSQLASIHEFGAPSKNIPARPFVRSAYDKNTENLHKMAEKELTSIRENKSNIKKSLGRMGEFLTGQIKKEIKTGDFVPLKPETIKRKHSSRPLIDTAQMLQSVTHVEVINE